MQITDYLRGYLKPDETDSPSTLETFPYFTAGDQWKTLSSCDWNDWVSGFWAGIHWMGTDTDVLDPDRAIQLTQNIEPIAERNINVGFRYQYSWLPAYETTGKPKFKRKALKGAERLSRCYDPELSVIGNYCEETDTVKVSSNTLMNIPLLLWAINHVPDSGTYRTYLEEFLSKATRLLVKENGAVRHSIHYDAEARTIKRVNSPHGVPGGCWSRGLAWMVYGLTLGGIFLDNEDYISTAKSIVSYHLENSYDLIPPFDYSISTLNQPDLTDTSAGAILGSALLTMGKLRNNNQAEKLGKRITKRLFNEYRREPDQDGLIDGGCFHYPEGEGVNEATVWGDFYALEAQYIRKNNELPTHLRWVQATPQDRAKAS